MTLSRRFNPCVPALVLAAAVLCASGAAAAPAGAAFFSIFADYGRDLDFIARRFSLVIWHNHPRLAADLKLLREKNPRMTGLMYRELFCVLREETPMAESVGRYGWIKAVHPEWFQKDLNGDPVEVPDYPGRFMMDPGNPQWQDFWIRETLREVVEGGWDGVFADDALTSVKMHGLPPLEHYPTDASLQAAFHGFLAKARAAFSAQGKLVIANVSNSYDHPGLFAAWLKVTDGILEEHFTGAAWTWGPQVGQAQMAAMREAKAAGKWYLCMTRGAPGDRPLIDLSLAAYLIGSGGKVAWTYHADEGGPETFPDDPRWSRALGNPLEDARQEGRVWSRKFENGVIFVNPGESPQRVTCHGEDRVLPPYSFKLI